MTDTTQLEALMNSVLARQDAIFVMLWVVSGLFALFKGFSHGNTR